MRYIVLITSDNAEDVDPKVVETHESYLDFLNEQGLLYASGPFVNRSGGMIILNAESMEEAQAIIMEMPLISQKLRKYEILEWDQTI